MKNWKVWPFVLACALILTVTVAKVPERGNKRFYGFGLALLAFPVVPLLIGGFSRTK
jgi:hypothetical protein